MAATKNKPSDDLLPDGAGGPSDDDVDISNLRVNFSDQEANSEARSFDPIPSGKYHVRLTDISTEKCGPTSKNPGKPYWHIEFTIQDGPHEDRKVWTNAMLFEGALYTLSQLLKATGNGEAIKTGKIPPADSFMGAELTIVVKKQVDTYAIEQGEWDGTGPKPFKNEVKGIAAADALQNAGSTGSLLP
jgi:hypothetical protein